MALPPAAADRAPIPAALIEWSLRSYVTRGRSAKHITTDRTTCANINFILWRAVLVILSIACERTTSKQSAIEGLKWWDTHVSDRCWSTMQQNKKWCDERSGPHAVPPSLGAEVSPQTQLPLMCRRAWTHRVFDKTKQAGSPRQMG